MLFRLLSLSLFPLSFTQGVVRQDVLSNTIADPISFHYPVICLPFIPPHYCVFDTKQSLVLLPELISHHSSGCLISLLPKVTIGEVCFSLRFDGIFFPQ